MRGFVASAVLRAGACCFVVVLEGGAAGCGSSVYSPGLPDSGAGPGQTPAGDSGAPPVTNIEGGSPVTGDCVGKSCPIPLVAGMMNGTSSYDVNGVALGGSNVFVGAVQHGQGGCLIGRVPKLGGNLETVYQAGSECGGIRRGGIAVAGSTVYLSMGTPIGGNLGISSVPTSGGTLTPVQSLSSGGALAAGDALYYVESGSGGDSQIYRMATTGGSTQLLQARPWQGGLAVSGLALFWLEQTPNSTSRLARGATSPSTVTYVIDKLSDDATVTANAAEVFWTAFKWPNCAIGRGPIEGGAATQMSIPCSALGFSMPPGGGQYYANLAADATDLIVGVGGRVYRVPL